jgi:hypothetical protein
MTDKNLKVEREPSSPYVRDLGKPKFARVPPGPHVVTEVRGPLPRSFFKPSPGDNAPMSAPKASRPRHRRRRWSGAPPPETPGARG